MLFEWDEHKRETNLAKHFIDFPDAKSVLRRWYAASGDESFQQGGQIGMKEKTARTISKARMKGKADFKRLRGMRDTDVDTSDIPKLDESFWKAAKLTMPEPKDRLTNRSTTISWSG